MEILDKLEDSTREPKYLKKTALLFKINVGLLSISILSSTLLKPLFKEQSGALDLLIAGPIIAFIFTAPIGIIYSMKSMRKKEGASKARFIYFIGHVFFFLLIAAMILSIISDFTNL